MAETAATPPNRLLLMLEGRAIPELFGFAASLPTLTALAPRGEGQPVLVLPGLTTSDRSTVALRRFLRSKGYRAYGWELGLNFGPRPGVEDGLIARVLELHEKYEQKVSLVGWSLGGIYARQLAKIMPEKVRQVISMGSPFRGDPRATNAWRVYQMASGQKVEEGEQHMGGAIHLAPPVPTTAIYSKTDGICAWQNCIEHDTDLTENIEVKASHCGLGHHPAAVYAVADRLSQPEGAWKKFDRSGVKSAVYAKPTYAI
ncbi:alpha/beta hydrolase [Sulfitobacter sp. JBTF-M27]|uniref:Alpha/beta hydrolase n=1 Tax=Sulfitobacter sediminilitoris TaxID=2698830 RepID=A0A6P0CAH5_9RHOB|nr:alpha/beta hydrolase [Sulfitobacter sediminilitoris]NEK23231.1 alpha/beta hydrolase [Sulfitobacter sediminilitoris]